MLFTVLQKQGVGGSFTLVQLIAVIRDLSAYHEALSCEAFYVVGGPKS